jgi:hypothetical protein
MRRSPRGLRVARHAAIRNPISLAANSSTTVPAWSSHTGARPISHSVSKWARRAPGALPVRPGFTRPGRYE